MSLAKLNIRILKHPEDGFEVVFNPTEYSVAKTNNWKEKEVIGRNVPKLEFTGGGARKLTLQLLFDVTETPGGDVTHYIKKMEALTQIDENLKHPKTKKGRPPLCLLQWGDHWTFKAAVTSLTVKYTLFRENGTPVRATVDVTFQEGETEERGTNPTSFALPGRKRREVQPYDTLPWIAYDEYGDAGLWRLIADENRLEDPLALPPGMILAIPPLP